MKPTDYEALAEDYARHRGVHSVVLEELVGALEPSARVLEVGCGSGNYVSAIHDRVGCDCVGVDPSPAMLQEFAARRGDIAFRECRAESLELEASTFDLVFSVDVIHHVTDRPAAIREAYRVLRPGGRICTVTDSEWVIRNRRPLSEYFPETVEPELKRYPRIRDLREAMQAVGFAQVAERLVEATHDLTDATPFRRRVFSSLHLIDERTFRRRLEVLEARLAKGPLTCTSRYCMVWGTKPVGTNGASEG